MRVKSQSRKRKAEGGRSPQATRRGERKGCALSHSAFRTPHSAISLTEVLIAMGILTLGLLGVAALFPVGSYYMQKAEVADNASSIARNVMSDVVARGMLNPDNWIAWEDRQLDTGNPLRVANARQYSYSRPFAESLRTMLAVMAGNKAFTPNYRAQYAAIEFGSAYVIDPLGIASCTWRAADGVSAYSNQYLPSAGNFPATGYAISGDNGPSAAWRPWVRPSAYSEGWPVRRVSFPQSSTGPLTIATANRLFSSRDDAAVELPGGADNPAEMRWQSTLADLSGSGSGAATPLARQSRGDYSWIVTVAPSSDKARDALATDPSAYEYNVSVVVFYKRVVPTTDPKDLNQAKNVNQDLLRNSERTVTASIVSTGLNGGEVLLTRLATAMPYQDPPPSPFDSLKVGQWIMLCGPHPASTDLAPRFVLNWYRVLSIQGEDERLDAAGNAAGAGWDGKERRLVSLRGPQWPWQPAEPGYTYDLSNYLCAGIFPGAVAVHTRTMRLEGNSPWSFQ